LLIVAAATVIAVGIVSITRLARAQRLEARLARVEAELYGRTTSALVRTNGPSMRGAAPLVLTPGFASPQEPQGSLEDRVEKIEREMTPHLELLSPATPEAPSVER
jgi:hypothetical protein